MTTASSAAFLPFRENRFLHWICAAMAAVIAISAYRPVEVYDWLLENSLVVVLILALTVRYRWITFSDLSYLLIFGYLCLHELGAHYKYSDVPFGEWMKPWLNTQRNSYDRVVHFGFGFLLGYPMMELFARKARVTGAWLYYLPFECTLALSCIYEILEAAAAGVLSPERGEEFVGLQGDIWDSQKDMFNAGLGSIAAMILIYIIRRRLAARKAAAVNS